MLYIKQERRGLEQQQRAWSVSGGDWTQKRRGEERLYSEQGKQKQDSELKRNLYRDLGCCTDVQCTAN
jgi:hypothetical protein